MGECAKCGAITTQVLELAWRAKSIVCRECLNAISFDAETLQLLRSQAIDATTSIDRLTHRDAKPYR